MSAVSATPDYDNRQLEIVWRSNDDGAAVTSYRYPFVWLRDSCRCADCFHPSTLSQKFTFDQLDIDCRPISVNLRSDAIGDSVDDVIVITWSDNHATTIPHSLLKRCQFVSTPVQRRRMEYKLWNKEQLNKLATFDFDKLLTDDRTLYDWITTLWVSGICLITGTPTIPGQLERIAHVIAYLRDTHYGQSFDVHTKANPSNLAYTTGKLGMHTDLAYENYVPGMQMLHCVVQTKSTGGANQFADGFWATEQLRALHPQYFSLLTTVPVDFYDIGNDVIPFDRRSTHPTIRLNERGEVVQISFSNHARDREQTSSRLKLDQVETFYRALKTFYDLLYSPDNLIEYKLCEATQMHHNVDLEGMRLYYVTHLPISDIICFHNYRVLHARSEFVIPSTSEGGKNVERHLVGGYIDWAEMLSKRRVLRRILKLHDDPEV